MASFTEREQKLLAAACQSFEGEPKVDMAKFAETSGLTVGSARNAWNALKKKIYAPVNDTPGQTPKVITKSSGKKRGAALRSMGGDFDEDEPFTPSKKPKGPTGIKSKAKAKAALNALKDADDEDEEDGFVKIKDEAANDEFEEL
ncbi:hypothetical protein E4T47_07809 [Aureobasidium subglaciale]|nr:hypothetical protein E4T47_07809 [Aureobasidium subglaciale]